MTQWIVLLRTGTDDEYAYGPLGSETVAKRFAAFLTTEVDPARVLPLESTIGEFLAWYDSVGSKRSAALAASVSPEFWPPQPGDIWQGSGGERWACSTEQHARRGVSYLVCLAFIADDSAEEVNRKYGPMVLVYRPEPREVEAPF